MSRDSDSSRSEDTDDDSYMEEEASDESPLYPSRAPVEGVPFFGGTDDAAADEAFREDSDSWLDEGLVTLLIVAGVILFLFPEPTTSGLGVLLIATGAVVWLMDWAT